MRRNSLIFVFVISFIFTISCKNNTNQKEYALKDLIDSENTYDLNDSNSILTLPNDIKFYKDSLAILTDYYNQSIYKYDFFQNKLDKIGNIGKGPGEYLNAFGLLIKNDRIYYSDLNESGIEKFTFDGTKPEKIENVNLLRLYPKIFFLDNDNTLFCLTELPREGYFVYSSNGKKYGRTLKIFSENRLNRYPFAGAYFNNNKLYFMYMVESKIYSININANSETTFKIDVDGFFNWDNVKDEKMTKEMDDNTRTLYSRVGKFLGFQFNGKTYFFISVFNNKRGNRFLICNEKGKILFSIKGLDKIEMEHITDDRCYAYPLNEKKFQIISFRWNKTFKSLLSKGE